MMKIPRFFRAFGMLFCVSLMIICMGCENKMQDKVIHNGITMTNTYFWNPSNVKNIGDPYILKTGSDYYMYCTSSGEGFRVWYSKNLNYWAEKGHAYKREADDWGVGNFWAPEVYAYKDQYYMFYSAIWKDAETEGSMRIGVAVSDSPEGPFVNMSDQPLFDFGYAVIDAHVLFDDDGRIYLYYSKDAMENIISGRHESHIYGIELSSDLTSVIGEPVLLTQPSQSWEFKSGDFRWNEGACVLKHEGTYYLTYTANYFGSPDYSVGYATGSSPLGPYQKYDKNPILKGDGVRTSGTGHNNYTISPDGKDLYMVYHSHTSVEKPSGDRQACMDKMGFRADGTLYVNGPSLGKQPVPSGTLKSFDATKTATITSAFQRAEGDPGSLKDGEISLTPESEAPLYTVRNSKGYIELKWDEPIYIRNLWVYPGGKAAQIPKSMDVVLDNGYKIQNITFDDASTSAAIAAFTNLPSMDDAKIKSLKIYLKGAGKEPFALSEIVVTEGR